MTIQIRSTDPWLLARLITDLQLEGFNYDKSWHKTYYPFRKGYWLNVYTESKVFRSLQYYVFVKEPMQRITESNYLEILETILYPESPVRG